MWLYWLGLCVHIIFILSVSEIFYKNYIGDGEWICKDRKGVAKRLVFIVVDGLEEYQLLLQVNRRFNRIINEEGIWGSALGSNIDSQYSGIQEFLAGCNVDPVSLYAKRFLFDPEPLDNFLNRSNSVFYFGSEEVYNYIYKRGQSSWWTYFFPEWENSIVNNVNYSFLANLAVHKFDKLFYSSHSNKTLEQLLHYDKTVFFIHFSFIARTGQLFGHSSNYTINAVDNLFSSLESIENLTENYFNGDRNTAYILCSNYRPDDGLSGGNVNRYPFVAWGSGIAKNVKKPIIRRIDIASLVSTLLSLSIPSHSRGRVPLEALHLSEEAMAEAQICNTMHLYYLAVESESNVPFNLSSPLTPIKYIDAKLRDLINSKKYSHIDIITKNLTSISLNKINSNESYFKQLIWFSTVVCLISWIIIIFSEILPTRESFENKSLFSFSELKLRVSYRFNNLNSRLLSAFRRKVPKVRTAKCSENNMECQSANDIRLTFGNKNADPSKIEDSVPNGIQNKSSDRRNSIIKWKWLRGVTDIVFFIIMLVIFLIPLIIQWPPQFLFYLTTPVMLLWLFSYALIDWTIFAKDYFRRVWKNILVYSVLFLFTSYLLAKGYNADFSLAFGIILVMQSLVYLNRTSWSVTMTWLVSGGLIIFLAKKGVWATNLPVEWGLIFSIVVLILWNLYATFRLIPKRIDFAVTVALLWLDGICLGCILFTDIIHSAGNETPCVLKVLCWLLTIAILLPVAHRDDLSSLVLNICMALSVPFILLSTAFEPLLYLLLSNFMISWMLLEGYTEERYFMRQLNGEDARRALLFVCVCIFTSRIIGNAYSFKSTNIYSVRCLIETLREPFVELILISKSFFLYAMLTTIFLIICSSNGLKISQGFNLVLLVFQMIGTILFFHIYQDEDLSIPQSSVDAVLGFFAVNIFIIILISVVLFCSYVYRLPISNSM